MTNLAAITAAGAGDLDVVRQLFREYAASLGVDLSFQDFDREMATLDTFYEVIFVAREEESIAGCVALRRLDATTCEMKRLYVRPAHRGRALGRTLVLHAIDEARRRDYTCMRLDTLPQMRAAIALYESLGFREIPPYRYSPVSGTRYMELDL